MGNCVKIGMGQTILKEDLEEEGIPVFSATEGDSFFGLISRPKVTLQCGDIVIPARGNSIGAVKLVSEIPTCTQTTIYCKATSDNFINSFVFYYFKGFREFLFPMTRTAINQVTVGEILSNFIPLPTRREQLSIVRFLDRETAKINALIAEQKRLIELLQEKRQSVISHAVTKGLNPNAPMKDSGMEWLGEVPEHWEVKALKRVSPKQVVGIVVNPS